MARIPKEEITESTQFGTDLKIDLSALDIEWEEQPQTFFKYSKELAYAKRELGRLKEKYEVLKAQVGNKIRSQYPDKKPTENAINSLIIQNKEIIQSAKDVLDQELVVDLLASGVKAFDQRKTALENEVKLLGMNYFAGPREPRNISDYYKKEDGVLKRIGHSTSGKR